tara:strand:+ start:1785 stop:3302 length:1518 start_codon:yes stop_codon:yes gene_type:complete
MKKKLLKSVLFFLSIFILISCNSEIEKKIVKPNFIIFIADDISWDDFGCYGNKDVKTPNIDRLAGEGLIFNNMYLTTSSCSPSRNSIITGRYPHNTGAPELHSQPPMDMKTFVFELKESGYFTVSSGKFHMGDYARKSFDIIYEGRKDNGLGGEAKWVSSIEKRPKDKPFFLWFASHDAHREWGENKFSGTHNPENLTPPEYLVNDEPTRKDLADYYDEIKRFDFSIGEVVEILKEQNIYDNTFIIVMADNGRPFPHSKTRLNDQGVKTPFILVYKDGKYNGKTQSLVSSIDIAPTILDFAGLEIGENYQGKSFKQLLEKPEIEFRNFIFAEHNWHDFESHERMVRSKEFMYIENNRNQYAQRGPLDAINSDTYTSLLSKFNSGEITDIQKEIFINPRAKEEFYEIKNDLFQRVNLIDNDKYQEKIKKLKFVLNQWKIDTGDSEPSEITKDWYERRPGPKNEKSITEKDEPVGGPYSLTTPFYGKRGEFPGESNNSSKINKKGPF